ALSLAGDCADFDVSSSAIPGVGCYAVRLGWIELVSLLPQPDLNVVCSARSGTIPLRVAATERPVTTNLILSGRGSAYVPVCHYDRGATHARVPAQHERQPGEGARAGT